MSKLSLGVVILVYKNATEAIRLTLELTKTNEVNTVVLVDNASPDNSFSKLQKFATNHDRVLAIKSSVNGGYASGNNLGVKKLLATAPGTELLLFANPDIIVPDNVVSTLKTDYSRLCNQGVSVGMVAPKICGKHHNSNVKSEDLPTYSDDIKSMLMPYRKQKSHSTVTDCKRNNIITTEIVSGAFFMISVELFQKVGMFDSRTFLYGEERILGLKLKSVGAESFFIENVSVEHVGSESIDASFRTTDKFRMLYKSRRIYQSKYLNQNSLNMMIYDLIAKISLIEVRTVIILKRILSYISAFVRKI